MISTGAALVWMFGESLVGKKCQVKLYEGSFFQEWRVGTIVRIEPPDLFVILKDEPLRARRIRNRLVNIQDDASTKQTIEACHRRLQYTWAKGVR